MKKIKTLIADDTVVYRSQIRSALESIPGIEVTGVAANGKIAIEKLLQTTPDLLILDLEMPEMDGLQTLTEIARIGYKCKVLVFSSFSKRGAEITMEALNMGASDFVTKPSGEKNSGDDPALAHVSPAQRIHDLLEPKIKALFPQSFLETRDAVMEESFAVKLRSKFNWDLFDPELVVIGASTGGPPVLEKIFTSLLKPLRCPIVIVQHMPPIFTATFAQRLSKVSGINCVEVKKGIPLEQNTAYIAPGGYHMKMTNVDHQIRFILDQGPLINSVRPAVDPLFSSAAQIFKNKCLGFVLTGMGADGRVGAEHIKKAGGAVVIQSEATCVVFGMPGAVKAVKAYDSEATPEEIISILNAKSEAQHAFMSSVKGGA